MTWKLSHLLLSGLFRDCIHTLHSRDTWMKQARVVRIGEVPYKVRGSTFSCAIHLPSKAQARFCFGFCLLSCQQMSISRLLAWFVVAVSTCCACSSYMLPKAQLCFFPTPVVSGRTAPFSPSPKASQCCVCTAGSLPVAYSCHRLSFIGNEYWN